MARNSEARKRLEARWEAVDEVDTTTIIGLSGYAQSGKDSTGRVLVERGFTRFAFADALRQTMYAMDPMVLANDGGCYALSEWTEMGFDYEWLKANTNLRLYLQRHGVGIREFVDPDAWVNAVFRQIEPGMQAVITDVRFPNEYEAVKARGGSVWRVVRADHQPPNLHVSETALDGYEFDQVLTVTDHNDDLDALHTTLNMLVGAVLL